MAQKLEPDARVIPPEPDEAAAPIEPAGRVVGRLDGPDGVGGDRKNSLEDDSGQDAAT